MFTLNTVNSELFARNLFSRNFAYAKFHESKILAKSLCYLLMKVNHVIVMNIYVSNMSFNAVRKNKILAKMSEFTVFRLQSNKSS